MITVSAPGKVHLMGEHAVVYGKPALLAAIDKRLVVTISQSTEGLTLQSDEPTDYLQTIIGIVMKHFHSTKKPDITVSVTSAIPAGYHLGSSAAVAVATVAAVTYHLKKIWNPTLINQLAYEAEKVKHGNPSGGDNTACAFGRLLWYRKELEFLKSMWQLPFGVHQNVNHFFLINTGKPKETTGEMVTFVRSQFTVHSSQFKKLFDENEEQTKRIAVSLKEGDEKTLIDAVQKGERTLETMGVVSKKVTPLLREIERAGGAVKILGGGGRNGSVGFLLCYHKNKKIIEPICNMYRFPIEPVVLGSEGVRLDER